MDAARDIRLFSNMYLAPARNGNLRLTAGGSIDGSPLDVRGSSKAGIIMSDLSPENAYGPIAVSSIDKVKELINKGSSCKLLRSTRTIRNQRSAAEAISATPISSCRRRQS
jgi:hypothetical protein